MFLCIYSAHRSKTLALIHWKRMTSISKVQSNVSLSVKSKSLSSIQKKKLRRCSSGSHSPPDVQLFDGDCKGEGTTGYAVKNDDLHMSREMECYTSKMLRRQRPSRKDLEGYVVDNGASNTDSIVKSGFSRSIHVATSLSTCVDIARETVCNKLEVCATWRRTATNIIIQLVQAYHVKDETAAHAITLLDRFLAANLERSSLVPFEPTSDSEIWDKPGRYAIACFLLATKFKDVCSPCIADLVRMVRPPLLEEQILQCEEEVLSSIGWVLHVTTGAASHCHPRPTIPSSALLPRAQQAKRAQLTRPQSAKLAVSTARPHASAPRKSPNTPTIRT